MGYIKTGNIQLIDLSGSTGDTIMYIDISGNTQYSETDNYTTEDFNFVEQFISATAVDVSGVSLDLWNFQDPNTGTTSSGSTLTRVGIEGQRSIGDDYAYICFQENTWQAIRAVLLL